MGIDYYTCWGGVSRSEGKWKDVLFEFDEHGILTESRFVDSQRLRNNLVRYIPYDRDGLECYLSCRSNYYSCFILKGNYQAGFPLPAELEEINDPLSQCDENLQTCFQQQCENFTYDCNVLKGFCYSIPLMKTPSYKEVTSEELRCVNEVVLCVQECSERFENNSGIDDSDKVACSFNCDDALKVCFESLEGDEDG